MRYDAAVILVLLSLVCDTLKRALIGKRGQE